MTSPESLRSLVQSGRVHRRLYTDPEIFEAEMERIFGAAWIYVGHESQIRNSGDYVRTFIGRKPVVLVRDADGEVRVIHNQCAHRGSLVVANDKGNTDEFQCCYHGWTYHLDGRLKAVPLHHGYPREFDPDNPKTAMVSAARVKSYRGFVFASESADGPSLEEFLGYMTTSFDDMIDRSPDGEIEVAGGTFQHAYEANWKLYLENLCDAAHPLFTHRSSIDAAQQQSDAVYSDGSGEIAIRQMRQNGAPYSFWESQVGIWTYPNGHSYLGDYHDDAKLVAADAAAPAYCDVHGTVVTTGAGAAEGLARFAMQLPEAWQRRFLFLGVGGNAGSLVPSANDTDRASALGKGYTTILTDTGHVGDGTTAQWTLLPDGKPDTVKRIDFFHRAAHNVTVAGIPANDKFRVVS